MARLVCCVIDLCRSSRSASLIRILFLSHSFFCALSLKRLITRALFTRLYLLDSYRISWNIACHKEREKRGRDCAEASVQFLLPARISSKRTWTARTESVTRFPELCIYIYIWIYIYIYIFTYISIYTYIYTHTRVLFSRIATSSTHRLRRVVNYILSLAGRFLAHSCRRVRHASTHTPICTEHTHTWWSTYKCTHSAFLHFFLSRFRNLLLQGDINPNVIFSFFFLSSFTPR